MLVHDKVFALRACERRTGSRARGASTARAAEPGCNKRSLESSNSIYTLYLHYLPPGPGVHVCIILEFTQNPGLRSGAGWTMDGTEDSWLVG